MVKIAKTSVELTALADWHYQTITGPDFEIGSLIDEIIRAKTTKAHEKDLFALLKKYLPVLIKGTPHDLWALEKNIAPVYDRYLSKYTYHKKGKDRQAAIKKAKQKITSVFCYDDFIRKADGRFAYAYTEKLDVNVCLYCNRQYTYTLYTQDGKCRPTLDHFLDKGTYPYFSLSFYNLIPSCYVCNSSLKNQQAFTLDTHLHPFLESMLDVLNFKIDIQAVDFITGKSKNFKVELSADRRCKNLALIQRAKENAKVFKIQELYEGHKEFAAEIIKKAYYYNKSKINEIYKFTTESGHRLFGSKEEVIEFALGNYINDTKLAKRVLAKFTRDLAKDLGMMKNI